jgi:L-ascorbate metabolism protein UlaG (beta-lactamase superfamily)
MSNLDVELTLIGGTTLLIELAGTRFLTDPTFDAPGRYESTGIVLEKQRGPAISAEGWERSMQCCSVTISTSTILIVPVARFYKSEKHIYYASRCCTSGETCNRIISMGDG